MYVYDIYKAVQKLSNVKHATLMTKSQKLVKLTKQLD